MGPLGVLYFKQVIDRGKHRHCITKIFSIWHFVSCFGVIHPCWPLQTIGLSSFQPQTSHNCNVSYSDIPLEFRISSSQISECIYIYLYGYFLLSSSWWMAFASRNFQQWDLSSPEISPSNKCSAWIQAILGMVHRSVDTLCAIHFFLVWYECHLSKTHKSLCFQGSFCHVWLLSF